jgi:hypothetical protein
MTTLISSHLDLGQRSILLQYVDAVRLNAISVEAVGLAYGLAGISIALMEIAALIGDKKLENEAISLLQSCLTNHHVDLSFENGWGGILYATRYLIRTGLLEIDYGEVLGKQEALVAKHIHELSADTHNFKSHVKLAAMLCYIQISITQVAPNYSQPISTNSLRITQKGGANGM